MNQESTPTKKKRDWYWLKLVLFVWAALVIIRTLDQLGVV